MLVFIDESGDSGMKGKPGSSSHFIITAVCFQDVAVANACDKAIDRLRQSCFRNDWAEFHFNTCSNRIRESFLSSVVDFDFRYWSLVLDKALLRGQGLSQRSAFYDYAAKLLLEMGTAHLNDAVICLDKSGSRDFYSHMHKVLRESVDSSNRMIRRIKSEPSHSNNLLQLADMICGAVARSYYRTKESSQTFRASIQAKEDAVRIWPRP
jgi:hypothetical protein